MFSKIKDVFSSTDKTVIWERDYSPDKENREMIFRFPNKDKPDFDDADYIGIRDYERGIYFFKGKSGGVLSGGHYKIEKEAKNRSTEIVWFDPGLVQLTWGIGWQSGIPARTQDGFSLGASGNMNIQIDDPESLITKVITGKVEFSDADLKKMIRSTITTSFRDVVQTYALKEFLTSDRDTFNQRMKTAAASELRSYGLKLDSMHVLGVTHPPEDERLVKQITEQQKELTGIKATSNRNQVNSLMQEISSVEGQISQLKHSIKELEMKNATGEINDEEFQIKIGKMNNLLNKREKELQALRDKINKL